jgi:two-component system response regulator NreC
VSAHHTPVQREPGDSIRVLLADDHSIVRRGISQVLERGGGFDVVAEAADVQETLRMLDEQRPDVLLLDLNMPGGSSLEMIPEMRRRHPETQIVVLTMQDEPAYVRRALRDGVLGYVLKDAADEDLVEAVREAAAGRRYLNPRLGARLASEPTPSPSGLSAREIDVLRLVSLGYTNNEIADRLVLSVRTVETHRAHIQHKLGLRARSELVRYALDNGLIQP